MPSPCRHAFESFDGPDKQLALRHGWDHCQDAVALLWFAALRARQRHAGAEARVIEEIERAKGRVLEPFNEPLSETAQKAQDLLVKHLSQPAALIDDSPAKSEQVRARSNDLEDAMPRELWLEYARRMGDVVEGIRINLRDLAVE
jgi:hypothetical protein